MTRKSHDLTLKQLRDRILQIRQSPNERRSYHTWQDVADEIWPGLNRGVIHKIAFTDYEPRDPVLRMKLGLGQKIEVPPCEICGGVHLKPHPKKVKRAPRVAISKVNMKHAARSIRNNLEPEQVQALIEELNHD